MNKLLLVDGSNLLFQMFYGMPTRIVNRHGRPIHGTLGFVGALLKILRAVNPTHVAVLFDGEHENSRAALNADYKANRTDYSTVDEQDNPFTQESDIYAALDRMNIKHAETTVCETDDWIAGYAYAYGTTAQIVISSFDSDYFQLITDNVSVLRYRGKRTAVWTKDTVREKLGISPDVYADYKSLVGDASDNIKGAAGIGPKTAAELVNKYGSLDGVIANAHSIAREPVKNSIMTGADRLRTNYKIIKLDAGAQLPFSIDELGYVDNNYRSIEILKDIGVLP